MAAYGELGLSFAGSTAFLLLPLPPSLGLGGAGFDLGCASPPGASRTFAAAVAAAFAFAFSAACVLGCAAAVVFAGGAVGLRRG